MLTDRSARANGHSLFGSYELDGAYDEMFDADGQVRPHYAPLYRRLQELTPGLLHERQRYADATFLNQGITFTVYGDTEGTERIFPYDLLPRILTAAEWAAFHRSVYVWPTLCWGAAACVSALGAVVEGIEAANAEFPDAARSLRVLA